jgi:mono/diheme cytochrome c family protein
MSPPSLPRFLPVLGVFALLSSGCSSDPDSEGSPGAPWLKGVSLPEEAQLPGNPEVGKDTLLNGNYMSCGIPYKLWADPNVGPIIRQGFGAGEVETLPGRVGKNVDVPHSLNAFTAADGTEVVNGNCLGCHSGKFDGELVLGLGNSSTDFTRGLGGGTSTSGLTPEVLDALGLTAAEKAHMEKIVRLARVAGPETVMRTVGNNWAEALTVVLVTHHDPETLAWSDEPLISFTIKDESGQPLEDAVLTSDPPPWWRAHKKNALFYNGMARGDHRGTMALATGVCVDDIAEAERVDRLFQDIQAYVESLRAPTYKRPIDQALAASGKDLFARDCAGCHGSYTPSPDDAHESYPNLLLPLDVIGTDPAVANGGVVHAPELVDWYNGSFYGQITRMEPNNPFPGYVAPPLDAVWATGPFLHNGSVPTIELVLNSAARPKYWKRIDYDSMHFDEAALGWPWEEVAYPQAEAPEEERKFIYDTTYFSQSNAGHTFGDHLSSAERRAVIEYLKTL